MQETLGGETIRAVHEAVEVTEVRGVRRARRGACEGAPRMSAVRAVRRRARVAWVAAVVIWVLGAACRHIYQRPTAAQPHALVKFRRVYGKTAGTRLHESVQVNGDLAFREGTDVSFADLLDVMVSHLDDEPARTRGTSTT